MDAILGFGFFSSLLTILAAVNLYVFIRLSGFLKIKRRLWFWLVLALCSMSFLIAEELEPYIGNILGRIVYTTCNNWLGVLWIFFVCLIVYEILRLIVRIKVKLNDRIAGEVIVIIASVLSIYSMINPLLLKVNIIDIAGPIDMDIVHMADLHIGSVGDGFLKKIVDKTAELEPDMVAITGDLIDSRDQNIQQVTEYLDTIDAPVFFVIGNHERYIGSERVTQILQNTNMRVLRNEQARLGDVQIVGIDDSGDPNRVRNILAGIDIDPNGYSVLLYHRPVGFKAAAEAGIDLMLAGHVHEGQLFPFNYIVGMFYEYMGGLHRYNDSHLYVTSGAGTWGPRMRLGSRSEIVLLRVRKKR